MSCLFYEFGHISLVSSPNATKVELKITLDKFFF